MGNSTVNFYSSCYITNSTQHIKHRTIRREQTPHTATSARAGISISSPRIYHLFLDSKTPANADAAACSARPRHTTQHSIHHTLLIIFTICHNLLLQKYYILFSIPVLNRNVYSLSVFVQLFLKLFLSSFSEKFLKS